MERSECNGCTPEDVREPRVSFIDANIREKSPENPFEITLGQDHSLPQREQVIFQAQPRDPNSDFRESVRDTNGYPAGTLHERFQHQTVSVTTESIKNEKKTSPNDQKNTITKIYREQEILDRDETLDDMIERVAEGLFRYEESITPSGKFDSAKMAEEKNKFIWFFKNDYLCTSSVICTNALRYSKSFPSYDSSGIAALLKYFDLGLASSAAPILNFNDASKDLWKFQAYHYFKSNMGLGINFDKYTTKEMINHIIQFNTFCESETRDKKYYRYIGNMGLLSATHPGIGEFIEIAGDKLLTHFNLSVIVSEAFMNAALKGEELTLEESGKKRKIQPEKIIDEIARAAHKTGNPGILYMDRLNRDNPSLSKRDTYIATPPCGEMGFAEGDTNHLLTLNISKFVSETGKVDWELLKEAVKLSVRVLDNAIQYTGYHFVGDSSTDLVRNRALYSRSIGIGIAGLADALITVGLPYASETGRTWAANIWSFINYHSKLASVELGEERGPCNAMISYKNSLGDSYSTKYVNENPEEQFLVQKFGNKPTDTVSTQQWRELSAKIQQTPLRNLRTVGLPPTGRTSIYLSANPSIEPLFGIRDRLNPEQLNPTVLKYIDRLPLDEISKRSIIQRALEDNSVQQISEIPLKDKETLRTATEISPVGHWLMTQFMTEYGDGGASKTINLPKRTTIDTVKEIFTATHNADIKGITIWVEK